MQLERSGEVVAAAGWDDQHGKLQALKRRQVSMNGTVSAEDENGFGFGGRSRDALDPLSGRIGPERFEAFG